MRIQYIGSRSGYGTRYAEIDYNEENEGKLAEAITDITERKTFWEVYGYACGDSGMLQIPMADRDDYDNFVEWYKEVKQSIKSGR